ncbi:MAG: N-(5'-phosphoribosyl)anthranilate isomerase [Halobacteriovoraceae bacterium]|nr:N-(5'-phosphoribosyl)anthranilate isomerase [Halobacteriovoraceae bacterium]|tara:strand:+ start:264 stop:920 length:657 start_codon:yes stop_codon:yes gene_type:complete
MKIKICGLKNEKDINKSIELGAWALGFIFYKKSSRFLRPDIAESILKNFEANTSKNLVGVFVNESISNMIDIQKKVKFHTFQLHGEEKPEVLSKIGHQFKIIKKLNYQDFPNIKLFLKAHPQVSFLIDSLPTHNGLYGGVGEVSDWNFARKVKEKIAPKGKLILAGGLNSKNLALAKKEVDPFAFDLSSSIESAPGLKDHKKLTELFSHIPKETNDEP